MHRSQKTALTLSLFFRCRERHGLKPVLLGRGSHAHAQLPQQRQQRREHATSAAATSTPTPEPEPRHVEQLPRVQPHVPGTGARAWRRVPATGGADGDGGSRAPPGRVELAGDGTAARWFAAKDAVAVGHVRVPDATGRRRRSGPAAAVGDQGQQAQAARAHGRERQSGGQEADGS